VPEEIHHSEGEIEHSEIRREETDASFAAILFILLGSVIVAFFIYVGVALFYFGWRDHEKTAKKSPYPLAPAPSTDANSLPPLPPGQPRLEQVDRTAGVETADVYVRQKVKEDYLNSSGPTKEKGFVHIPIGEAMKRLENQLPVRAQPPADQAWRSEGLIDAGESNSGREFRGKVK
jgi:hypothetical protein